ncbi:LOW QUALITY PROTEIN: potassium/sodium hyperpolarization-activated cyclic nucleotide-gated channel 2-like [Amphiura filiformis]|uniref:LOW QUALITY PROTEIN: potassium/sodium hyperpolarization-activated cyclic nucleotide-gated channel 2-like n=1 Tax=Amphiura filiformis TaxID=82378 RepID=UPI003B21A0A9
MPAGNKRRTATTGHGGLTKITPAAASRLPPVQQIELHRTEVAGGVKEQLLDKTIIVDETEGGTLPDVELCPKPQNEVQNTPRNCGYSAAVPDWEEVVKKDEKIRTGRRSSVFRPTIEHVFHASDKDFVKKIYRSDKALKAEQARQLSITKFVIHPFSNFRWYWDLFMVLLMGITLAILPVNIAFFSSSFFLQWTVINCIMDSLFITDIILNFFTGVIYNGNEVVLERGKIVAHYFKSWFIIDFVSSFPFDYIYLFMQNDQSDDVHPEYDSTALTLRVLRLAKVLSILRLLRLARLLRYVHRLEEILNIEGAVIRIVNLVLVALVLSHWNGCIQFLIPFMQDFPNDSWVVINGLQNADKWTQYSWSFFKAICHMLSIGFGRFPPMNVTEMWTTTISMMLGATFYALFIGHMSTLLLSIDASGRMYNEKINQAKEYMRYRKVPCSLQKRVLEYYEHRYQRKYFNEQAILDEQSTPLRREIEHHNLKSLVNKVDFLKDGDPDFVIDVIEKLKFEVYLPGDTVIKAGGRGRAMFFIEHGTVEIKVDGEVVASLSDGSHFGEISLLIDNRRMASVSAATTCDLYRLNKEDFNEVVDEHPEMGVKLDEIAHERIASVHNILSSTNERIPSQMTVTEDGDPIDSTLNE